MPAPICRTTLAQPDANLTPEPRKSAIADMAREFRCLWRLEMACGDSNTQPLLDFTAGGIHCNSCPRRPAQLRHRLHGARTVNMHVAILEDLGTTLIPPLHIHGY